MFASQMLYELMSTSVFFVQVRVTFESPAVAAKPVGVAGGVAPVDTIGAKVVK